MTTVLDKELRRLVTVDGVDYTVTLEPKGFRLTGKGKRTPEIELLWRDLLSGEAALATALNASLQSRPRTTPAGDRSTASAAKRAPKRSRA